MFWKIYAWTFVSIFIIGSFVGLVILPYSSLGFAELEGLLESIFLSIGVIAFAYKKTIFTKNTWKIVFVLINLIWILQIIAYSITDPYYLNLFKNTDYGIEDVLFSLIASTPALVTIYILGFGRKTLITGTCFLKILFFFFINTITSFFVSAPLTLATLFIMYSTDPSNLSLFIKNYLILDDFFLSTIFILSFSLSFIILSLQELRYHKSHHIYP